MTESGQTLGPYHLEDALGGTRTVFRARHVVSGDVVCVKLLPEHLRLDAINRGRRKRELLATRQVQHRGVGRPLDFVDAGGRLFLVMEYVEGAPLSLALFGGVTLPAARALRVVRGACEAVAAAHAAHATHGCLEPDKVLLAQDAGIHVVGFGFRDEDALKHPGDDAPAELDLCTAPERWSGTFETPEADVWALGALLYRCLSGAYPFEAETRAELSHQVQTSDVVPPRFDADIVVKPAIEAVVLRALSRDPVLRYPDAAVLARALLELEGMIPPELEPEEEPLPLGDDDVELLSLEDDPPPPPADAEAVAALAALEDAIQSHEAFADPFAAGLLSDAEILVPPVHAPIDDEDDDAPASDERTRVERSVTDATTVEAPSLDGTTVERPSVEMPSLALPSLEQAVVGQPLVDAQPLDAQPLDAQPLDAQPVPEPASAELAEEDFSSIDDIDVDAPEAEPEPPAEGAALPRALPPPLLPPPEEQTVMSALPLADEAPARGRKGLYAAALTLAVAAAAFVVVDPLGMRGDGDSEGPPSALALSVPPPPEDTVEPTAPPAALDVPTPPGPEPAAAADAGAVAATEAPPSEAGASAGDAGEPALAAADEPAQDDTEAAVAAVATEDTGDTEAAEALSPKDAYEATESSLEQTITDRGLLWKDDRELDRLRLRARRQAKARRFQAAARTAEAAVEVAAGVEIDDKLVKRKLLRYVKRRKQVREDDVAKRARALETRARQHLKDGEPAEANELLNAGLRLMYRPE